MQHLRSLKRLYSISSLHTWCPSCPQSQCGFGPKKEHLQQVAQRQPCAGAQEAIGGLQWSGVSLRLFGGPQGTLLGLVLVLVPVSDQPAEVIGGSDSGNIINGHKTRTGGGHFVRKVWMMISAGSPARMWPAFKVGWRRSRLRWSLALRKSCLLVISESSTKIVCWNGPQGRPPIRVGGVSI